MSKFRFETILDSSSGKIFVEMYYPDSATTPYCVTEPIYSSHEEAESAILEEMKKSISENV